MFYFLMCLMLGYFLLKEAWNRWHYDIHKIPAPPKLPILGHALSLRKGDKTLPLNIWVQEWRAKLGFPKVMQFCLFGRTLVFVMDINLVRDVVLAKAYGNPKDKHITRNLQRLVMDDDPTRCMATTVEITPYVKVIRRCYAESFTSAGMKTILEKQKEVLHQGKLYLEEKQDQETIDLQDFFIGLMLDVAGKVELDVDLGGLDKSSPLCDLLIRCGHHLNSFATNPFVKFGIKLFPNSKLAQKITQDFSKLNEQWAKIAFEVHSRGDPDEVDVTFAANLRRVYMPGTNDPLPTNLLKGELASAIVGGFDSTSHQLSWIFALLATHPSVMDKLLDELKIHQLYGNNAKMLEFEDLSELKYLTAVVKESMRMIHISVLISGKVASQDLVLDGYRVLEGTLMLIPSNFSMNCEAEWEDHLSFKPERWLDDNIHIKEKYYVPFSLGERDCPGMKLAMQLMKVTIVYFITRFSFELVGDTIESLVQNGVAVLCLKRRMESI